MNRPDLLASESKAANRVVVRTETKTVRDRAEAVSKVAVSKVAASKEAVNRVAGSKEAASKDDSSEIVN